MNRPAGQWGNQQGVAVSNVRAAGAGSLSRGRLVEVPVEEREPVLRAFLDQVRGGVRFFGSSDPNVVAARGDRYPVFRVAPDEGDAAAVGGV